MTPRPYSPEHEIRWCKKTCLEGQLLWSDAVRDPENFMHMIGALITVAPHLKQDLLLVGMLTVAVSQWSKTKGIYDFDDSLATAISDARLDDLTDGPFFNLPEWGVYIPVERKVGGQWLHGGYVAAVIKGDQANIFSIAVLQGTDPKHPYRYNVGQFAAERHRPLHFLERRQAGVVMPRREVQECILLRAAYLCAAEPDVRNRKQPKTQPKRQRYNGPVRQWEVGFRFGAAFRKQLADAQQQARTGHGGQERDRPRVHVRRAHWHTYLSGPRDQERQREVRWMPPVIVNAHGGVLPTIIWKQE